MSGPLAGIRVVEFAGIGPGPYAGMLLADLGAEVIVIDRPGFTLKGPAELEFLRRGKRSVALNTKNLQGRENALQIVSGAHALIEGFRPGVMERLGLGPEECLQVQPALIYGRMTGWGQDGPLAQRAGHDINYLGLSGALHAIGTQNGGPIVPLNIVGDFGGGGMFLALGLVSAILHAKDTGKGQVVDASIVDGTASLMTMMYSRLAMGLWRDERESNLLDGGTPYYATYRCSDGKWMAVGAIEPQFFSAMLSGLGIDETSYGARDDRSLWPRQRGLLQQIFGSRTRDDWAKRFEGLDACVTPVLSMHEAPLHPHNAARQVFTELGAIQPSPAPRFSDTSCAVRMMGQLPGQEVWPIHWTHRSNSDNYSGAMQ